MSPASDYLFSDDSPFVFCLLLSSQACIVLIHTPCEGSDTKIIQYFLYNSTCFEHFFNKKKVKIKVTMNKGYKLHDDGDYLDLRGVHSAAVFCSLQDREPLEIHRAH